MGQAREGLGRDGVGPSRGGEMADTQSSEGCSLKANGGSSPLLGTRSRFSMTFAPFFFVWYAVF